MNNIETALERIKLANKMRERLFDTPFYVAYSGGKDSDVIRLLFEEANVPYELYHNHTTVDAPETVRYVRSIPNIIIEYPDLSMWQLIIKKGVPPTSLMRYCCEKLKERGGRGRFVVTGVRWAESSRRAAQRGSLEASPNTITREKRPLILNVDNREDRRLFETCKIKGKRILNPIVDWTDEEVWEFLRSRNCESNPLYKEGFDRIGCVGCPLAGIKKRLAEFERYPKYKQAYLLSFDKMLEHRKERGLGSTWSTAQEVMDWWLEGR